MMWWEYLLSSLCLCSCHPPDITLNLPPISPHLYFFLNLLLHLLPPLHPCSRCMRIGLVALGLMLQDWAQSFPLTSALGSAPGSALIPALRPVLGLTLGLLGVQARYLFANDKRQNYSQKPENWGRMYDMNVDYIKGGQLWGSFSIMPLKNNDAMFNDNFSSLSQCSG